MRVTRASAALVAAVSSSARVMAFIDVLPWLCSMVELICEVGSTLHEIHTVLYDGMLEMVDVAKADPSSRSVFHSDPDGKRGRWPGTPAPGSGNIHLSGRIRRRTIVASVRCGRSVEYCRGEG